MVSWSHWLAALAGMVRSWVSKVLWAGWDLGLKTAGLVESPILGNAGNHEYLAWLSGSAGSSPTVFTDRLFPAPAR